MLLGDSDRRGEQRGLDSREKIALFVEREHALRCRAERRQIEARVRHSNFELVRKILLLALLVIGAIVLLISTISDPELLKIALPVGGLGLPAGLLADRWGGNSRQHFH